MIGKHVIHARVITFWLLIVVSVQITLVTSESDVNNKLRIERGEVQSLQAILANIDEYNVNLFLPDGDFNSIQGSVDIELRLAGCRNLEIPPSYPCDETDWSERIILFMPGNDGLDIKDVSLVVADSWKNLCNGLHKTIGIKQVLIDAHKSMIMISFEQEFPAHSLAKLSIVFSLRKYDYIQMNTEQVVQLNQEPSKILLNSQHRQTRLQMDQVSQLFPRFETTDEPLRAMSRVEFKIRYPENGSTMLVSNVPWDGKRFMLDRFTEDMYSPLFLFAGLQPPIPFGQLVFALIPAPQSKRIGQSSGSSLAQCHPIIERQVGLEEMKKPAEEFLKDIRKWMKKFAPDRKFDKINQANLKFLSIKGPSIEQQQPATTSKKWFACSKSSKPSSVEMELTIALMIAREFFSNLVPKEGPSESWIIDGLSTYYAIEWVRYLKPKLNVDEYVRSHLIPRALEYEAAGGDHYDEMMLSHPKNAHESSGDSLEEEQEERRPETDLLRRIKCAAIIDMLKRTFSTDKKNFDGFIGSFMMRNSIRTSSLIVALKTMSSDHDGILSAIRTWTEHKGYPYIGVSLDKQAGSIRLDQVPISWLNQDYEDERLKEDLVWPIPIRIKFTDGEKKVVVTRPVSSMEGFNGQRSSFTLKLPEWFEYNNRKHRVTLDLNDQEGLSYFQVGYSSDLI
uniref:Uncharacterized protein n=1 Tax=Aceria tosichella TaxID=561515 RepID=A0A6G1SD83_9ACAR